MTAIENARVLPVPVCAGRYVAAFYEWRNGLRLDWRWDDEFVLIEVVPQRRSKRLKFRKMLYQLCSVLPAANRNVCRIFRIAVLSKVHEARNAAFAKQTMPDRLRIPDAMLLKNSTVPPTGPYGSQAKVDRPECCKLIEETLPIMLDNGLNFSFVLRFA